MESIWKSQTPKKNMKLETVLDHCQNIEAMMMLLIADLGVS